ncbi:MAG TPA: PAS domain-containing protein [Deltaproteobacteria bacterium]|nr:PAS domain-containing protein [Deltaproteobacteria bacterium]
MHTQTRNTALCFSAGQILEIRKGLQEIQGVIMRHVPEDKRQVPLSLLNEYLETLHLAALASSFGKDGLFYPRPLYNSLFMAANESNHKDAPAWILEHMIGTHLLYDENGRILQASGTIAGHAKEEIAGSYIFDFIVPEHIPAAFEPLGDLLRCINIEHTCLLKAKDGSRQWYTFYCHPYRKGDKVFILAAAKAGGSSGERM